MTQTSFHQGSLGFFKSLVADSGFVRDGLLSLQDQNFSVSQVFGQGFQVLGHVLSESSLLDSSLGSESSVLILDNFVSLLDNLCVGGDVDGVNSVGQVLDLNFLLGFGQSLFVKFMSKG